LWLFLLGGLFIAVVMYFPNGLAGVVDTQGRRLMQALKRGRDVKPRAVAAAPAPRPEPQHNVTGLEATK
jgi:urea transport system permease protein